MKRRRGLWTYAMVVCMGAIVAVLVGVISNSLEGNLSLGLAAAMLVLVTLVSGFTLYRRVKKPKR